MKIIAFLICLTALLTGCHKEVADPIGIDDTDHIKLSAKELLFDATASKQPVTTEGDFGGWTGLFTWMASASIPMIRR